MEAYSSLSWFPAFTMMEPVIELYFLHQRLLLFDETLINWSLTGVSLIFNYAYLGFNEEKKREEKKTIVPCHWNVDIRGEICVLPR